MTSATELSWCFDVVREVLVLGTQGVVLQGLVLWNPQKQGRWGECCANVLCSFCTGGQAEQMHPAWSVKSFV